MNSSGPKESFGPEDLGPGTNPDGLTKWLPGTRSKTLLIKTRHHLIINPNFPVSAGFMTGKISSDVKGFPSNPTENNQYFSPTF
jgi:hypothetical protein